MKINPGIPVAEIKKEIDWQNRMLIKNGMEVIPPIEPRHYSADTETQLLGQGHQHAPVSEPQPEATSSMTNEEEVISPMEFLEFVKLHPNTKEFVYMVAVNSSVKGQTSYNPYDLKIVNFFAIDTKSPEGYFTMSAMVVLIN